MRPIRGRRGTSTQTPGRPHARCSAALTPDADAAASRAARSTFYYKIGGKSMGKRELLIIVAFAAVGVVVYQLTAPPSATGRPRRFSLSALVDAMHRNARGEPHASPRRRTTAVSRRPDARRRPRVERRRRRRSSAKRADDIAYSLTIESGGPDPAAAQAFAERATLETHDTGSALSVRPAFVARGAADRTADACTCRHE